MIIWKTRTYRSLKHGVTVREEHSVFRGGTKCAQMNEYRQTSPSHNSFCAETLFKSLLLRTKRELFGSYFCAGGFEPERRVPVGGKTAEALPAAEKARRFW